MKHLEKEKFETTEMIKTQISLISLFPLPPTPVNVIMAKFFFLTLRQFDL